MTPDKIKFDRTGDTVICYGHISGWCMYSIPHNLGDEFCAFNEDSSKCDPCHDGHCDYHEHYSKYDPASEALTAAQRNAL